MDLNYCLVGKWNGEARNVASEYNGTLQQCASEELIQLI